MKIDYVIVAGSRHVDIVTDIAEEMANQMHAIQGSDVIVTVTMTLVNDLRGHSVDANNVIHTVSHQAFRSSRR